MKMMDESEQDLTGISFRDTEWIRHIPLNRDTVLDYFANSQFYDRACNNERVKMERLDPSSIR